MRDWVLDPPSRRPPYATTEFFGKNRVPSSERMSPPTVNRFLSQETGKKIADPLMMLRRVSSEFWMAEIAARLRVAPPNHPPPSSVRVSGDPSIDPPRKPK